MSIINFTNEPEHQVDGILTYFIHNNICIAYKHRIVQKIKIPINENI